MTMENEMKPDWQLLCGDCLDLLPQFKNQVHLVGASPLYNVGMDYGDGKDNKPLADWLSFVRNVLSAIGQRFALPQRRFRRRILFGLLLGGIAFSPVNGASSALPQRFEFSEPRMGVPFRIVLYAASEETAKRAAAAAFSRIAALDQTLSNYDTDSELSRLGHQSGRSSWTPLGEDLYRVMACAQRLAAETNGAFDLTVGPLSALWRNTQRTLKYPEADQLSRFLKRVGWRHLQLDHSRRQARLTTPGMRLDPGGIAKGDALDQALLTLQQHGVQSALVAGDGDIAVSEPPPQKKGWRIRLAPLAEETPPDYVLLKRQAIAASGDLYQYVVLNGQRYSHIVDPRTGIGLTERRLVFVIAPSGIIADGLATALSVLDISKAEALLKLYPGSHARIISLADGRPLARSFGRFDDCCQPPNKTLTESSPEASIKNLQIPVEARLQWSE